MPSPTALQTPCATNASPTRIERRTIPIPPHRYSACRASWLKIYPPLVQHLHLQVRFNIKHKAVELRTSSQTEAHDGAIQQGADFVQAFVAGFEVEDAIAFLRHGHLYVLYLEDLAGGWEKWPSRSIIRQESNAVGYRSRRMLRPYATTTPSFEKDNGCHFSPTQRSPSAREQPAKYTEQIPRNLRYQRRTRHTSRRSSWPSHLSYLKQGRKDKICHRKQH